MSISGIQGHLLEVTVVGCNKLKDTEWISRQDPYVCLEYANTKFRTRTCTDGGKNPLFQEKFVFSLIEGLREINVVVWNSNTITFDDHIGTGRVQLQKVLSQGFDDAAWPLQSKSGKYAGEVRLILHYPNVNKLAHGFAPSAPPTAMSMPYASAPLSAASYPPIGGYPPPPTACPAYQNPPPMYPPPPQHHAYPPPQHHAYPPQQHHAYPPPQPSAYPPQPVAYPPSPHPPPPYPPSQSVPSYPGHYPGTYPPY